MHSLKNNYPGFKNLHLTISVILIIPVALTYGSYPDFILPGLFDFKIVSRDLANIFRATMGLYLGMAIIWIVGIFNPKFWTAATIANIVFMGGLAFGRLISLALDGLPSNSLLLGLIVEVALTFLALINFKKYGN